jgi:predicted MFS family arabinose efflux permease
LSNFNFFLTFGIFQLVTLAFEIPAAICLLKVKVPNIFAGKSEKIDMLAPYRDKKIRMVLLINVLHRFVNGFTGAYITVYFVEVARFSMTALLSITILLGLILTVTLPGAGKAMDRWGYGRFFVLLSGAMLLGMTLF